MPAFPGTESKTKFPCESVSCVAEKVPVRNSTCAPATLAPLESWTTPSTRTDCAAAAVTNREQIRKILVKDITCSANSGAPFPSPRWLNETLHLQRGLPRRLQSAKVLL